ncbi:hypothetical protein Tco_1179222 [Tanacetum coccineum]
MSGQTRSSVGVDEETRESLRDTIALLMREELEKLRDEIRKCSRVTQVKFPRFGGDDVKAIEKLGKWWDCQLGNYIWGGGDSGGGGDVLPKGL